MISGPQGTLISLVYDTIKIIDFAHNGQVKSYSDFLYFDMWLTRALQNRPLMQYIKSFNATDWWPIQFINLHQRLYGNKLHEAYLHKYILHHPRNNIFSTVFW